MVPGASIFYIYIYRLYLNRSTCTKMSRSIRGNNDTINYCYIITEIVKEMCTPMILYPPTTEHLKTFAILIRLCMLLLS